MTGFGTPASDDEIMVRFYMLADKDMLPDGLKSHLVQQVKNRGTPVSLFGIQAGKSTRYDHVTPSTVSISLKDLAKDYSMRKGVITRACGAIITKLRSEFSGKVATLTHISDECGSTTPIHSDLSRASHCKDQRIRWEGDGERLKSRAEQQVSAHR